MSSGMKPVTLEEKRKLGGGYNTFLQTTLPEKFRVYNPAEETVDSAHVAFTTAFPRGFALEVLQVYSGPPVIVYKFRHWGHMEGPFKGHAATGEVVELHGMSIFEVHPTLSCGRILYSFFLNLKLVFSSGKPGGWTYEDCEGWVLYGPWRATRRFYERC